MGSASSGTAHRPPRTQGKPATTTTRRVTMARTAARAAFATSGHPMLRAARLTPTHSLFFFLKNTAPPEFSPLPLPAPLPISPGEQNADRPDKPADHRIGGVQAEPHPAHTGHDGGHGPHDRDEPREDHRPRAETFEEGRSEEHTSELQSQSNLVCRLLLEKKKI